MMRAVLWATSKQAGLPDSIDEDGEDLYLLHNQGIVELQGPSLEQQPMEGRCNLIWVVGKHRTCHKQILHGQRGKG